MSVVFDYEGNLWFATGGFRIYPDRKQQGAVGYIAKEAIDAILNGEEPDLSKTVFVHALAPGEGTENGIASSADVAEKYGYNNMAIGMYAGNSGNALHCPTGYLELLRLQDRFVYLPEMPYRSIDLDKAMRNVLTQEQFLEDGGTGNVMGWLNTVTVENVHPNTVVALRMNNLSGNAADLKAYAYKSDGNLIEIPKELWSVKDESGAPADNLFPDTLYDVLVTVTDGDELDLNDAEKEIKISVVLGR